MNIVFDSMADAIEAIKKGGLSHAELAKILYRLSRRIKPSTMLASKTGLKPYTVRQYVQIGRRLDEKLIEALHSGRITFSMARALAVLPHGEQITAAEEVRGKNLSVRAARDLVADREPDQDNRDSKYYQQLSMTASEHSGLSVRIVPSRSRRGAGEVRLRYVDDQDFDVIFSKLGLDLSNLV